MKIVLGVLDIPYQNFPTGAKGKVKTGEATTGDVAEWLENKYEVMGRFVELHSGDIAKSIEKSMAGAIQNLMMGAPVSLDPLASATSEIETLFKFTYLDNEEIAQTGAQGVPTEAAKRGVNHRLKIKRGAKRPSFIDTGQYQTTMKSWTE